MRRHPLPSTRAALVAFAVLGVAASGCATPGAPGTCRTTYRFPARFDLVQLVEVERGDGADAFFASVRRRGDRFDIVLLDPVLQRPLVEAAYVDGAWSMTTSQLPAEAAERMSPDLFEPIRTLFVAECFEPTEAGLRRTGPRFRTVMDTPSDGACPFPERIRMRARGFARFGVTATTRDVRCGDP